MTFPIAGPDDPTAMDGYTYSGVFVRATHGDVLDELTGQRFTGWLGPQEGDWVLAVAEEPLGPVAGNATAFPTVAAQLARNLSTVIVLARIERDRLLRLDGWDGTGDLGEEDPRELGSYVSDPTVDAPDDDEVFPGPVGADHAAEYAEACGRGEAAEELLEVLAEELDIESVFESERLDSVLRLLDLPRWLISAESLPGDVPAGPRRGELVRLGAGKPGVQGLVAGAVTGVIRRRRRPQ